MLILFICCISIKGTELAPQGASLKPQNKSDLIAKVRRQKTLQATLIPKHSSLLPCPLEPPFNKNDTKKRKASIIGPYRWFYFMKKYDLPLKVWRAKIV